MGVTHSHLPQVVGIHHGDSSPFYKLYSDNDAARKGFAGIRPLTPVQLTKQVSMLQSDTVRQMETILETLQTSLEWKILNACSSIMNKLLPPKSIRRRICRYLFTGGRSE